MAPSERIAEIGAILAAGIQRQLADECKPQAEAKIGAEHHDLLAEV